MSAFEVKFNIKHNEISVLKTQNEQLKNEIKTEKNKHDAKISSLQFELDNAFEENTNLLKQNSKRQLELRANPSTEMGNRNQATNSLQGFA